MKRNIAISALFLAFILGLAGCDFKLPVIGPKTEQPQTELLRNPTLEGMYYYYNQGNLAFAAEVAQAYLLHGTPSPSDQAACYRIIALAANAQSKPNDALRALESWRGLQPRAAAGDDWLEIWTAALAALPYSEASVIATRAATDDLSPWQLQLEGRMFILESRLRAGMLEGLTPELERAYKATPDINARKKLEQRLFGQLHRSGQSVVQSLAASVNELNEGYYPYALYRLEEARRLYLDTRTQELALEMVSFLKDSWALADRSLLQTWNDPDLGSLPALPAHASGLALVLPMSGQYGNLSDKIVQGAELACKGFARNGHEVRLYVIDTDKPDWLSELAKLPEKVQIVGGPLRFSDYTAIKTSGDISKRKFFAFLRTLEAAETPAEGGLFASGPEEGRLAWRFFSSDEDQVSAVIRFARNLGVENFAALVPDENYGQRMLSVYRNELPANGGHFVTSSTYPAGLHQEWNKLVAGFLNTTKDRDKPPATPFQALFLPDSWQNASIMTPHFMYYRENRVLFMGTMLWEQGISLQKRADWRNYRRIIFPGAWDPNTVAPSGMVLRTAMAAEAKDAPDFWMSLGYDFVSMAAALNIPERASTADVNKALSMLVDIPWSGAPFAWDNNGRARQDLFVFTPADTGFTLADPAKFRAYMRSSWPGLFK